MQRRKTKEKSDTGGGDSSTRASTPDRYIVFGQRYEKAGANWACINIFFIIFFCLKRVSSYGRDLQDEKSSLFARILLARRRFFTSSSSKPYESKRGGGEKPRFDRRRVFIFFYFFFLF